MHVNSTHELSLYDLPLLPPLPFILPFPDTHWSGHRGDERQRCNPRPPQRRLVIVAVAVAMLDANQTKSSCHASLFSGSSLAQLPWHSSFSCTRVPHVRYGWHFPELGKIIADNLHYARTVKLMGHRVNCAAIDFSEVSSGLLLGRLGCWAE